MNIAKLFDIKNNKPVGIYPIRNDWAFEDVLTKLQDLKVLPDCIEWTEADEINQFEIREEGSHKKHFLLILQLAFHFNNYQGEINEQSN